jgi:hypothetical protein
MGDPVLGSVTVPNQFKLAPGNPGLGLVLFGKFPYDILTVLFV